MKKADRIRKAIKETKACNLTLRDSEESQAQAKHMMAKTPMAPEAMTGHSSGTK